MGNCYGSKFDATDSSSTNPSSLTKPSYPGNLNNYSEGDTFTTRSSSLTQSEGSLPSSGQILLSSSSSSTLKIYSFSELKSSTRNFKPEYVLGTGGFGTVFKGWVDDKTLAPSKPGIGIVVAIKKLNSQSIQGFDEWQSEVNFLGRLSHPNLVKLLGYCWEEKELLLVYEYMQKGSLENLLFRRSSVVEALSWDTRMKIAVEAAKGLAFLHDSERQVIYRDFKASNILLDGDYNAKISDFGLAKMGPSAGNSHVTTRVMGTYGYAAPEYVATGHLYVKSDVYGFGMVLLEMLTGLRAVDTSRPNGQHNLFDWKKPNLYQKRKLKHLMDHRIEGQYSSKAAFMAAQLTLKCLQQEPKRRPSMKEVVVILQHIQALRDGYNPKVFFGGDTSCFSSRSSSSSSPPRSSSFRERLSSHRYSLYSSSHRSYGVGGGS